MSTQENENNHLIALYAKRDISLVRGDGVFVYDEEGNEYLDCVNGMGVVILGHNNHAYVQAVKDQVGEIITVHSSFFTKERAAFLQTLHSVLPKSLTHSYISNSGTEAVEAALKFARLVTGKPGVISAFRGYHGRTYGAMSVGGTEKYRKPFEPLLDHMAQVPFNNIEALKEAYTDQIGAVLLEPIQGEGGVFIPNKDYLAQVKAFCEDKGILCIFDEVQSGFRTGTWLASESFDVTPDMVCLSKALGNGLPIAVTSVTSHIADQIPKGAHGSTFGSNPLSCRAARATIEEIQKNNLFEKAKEVGNYFVEQLQALDAPLIREVRGRGLFIGIDLKRKAGLFAKKLQEEHNILAMPSGTVLRFLPSLIFEKTHADRVVTALKEVLK